MTISRKQVLGFVEAVAMTLHQNKEHLTDLDAAIGDADHGINMDRGFKAVMARLPTVQEKDIGMILKSVGMALVSTVGGAAGPLYGTFFLRMGAIAADKLELTAADMSGMLDAGVKGVAERGRASLNEKTMIDALQPAADALRQAVAQGEDIEQALRLASAAAEQGMQATIEMKALKGRASYLGERSVGHQDPGATSACLILQALSRSVCGES